MCPKLLEVIFPSQLKFTVWKSTMYSFFFSSGGKSPPKNHILLTAQTKEQVLTQLPIKIK